MRTLCYVLLALLAPLAIGQPLLGQSDAGDMSNLPLADRISHVDPSEYTVRPSVHAGAGPMNYGRLVTSPGSPSSNLYFVSRGLIEPGGGIGHHFHNHSEEMFIILSGEAELTINGRTSRVEGPAGAPNVMGSSHAVYNPTDEPVEWMNINVTAVKGEYDAFDLDDPRVGVELDSIPVFMVMDLDRDRLRENENMNGGSGAVQYRRALQPSVFRTPWAYVDHVVLPPGTSVGAHLHSGVSEWHYVMSGEGAVTLHSNEPERGGRGTETAVIGYDDAFEIHYGEIHSLENTGGEPLELMIVGVARELPRDLQTIDVPIP